MQRLLALALTFSAIASCTIDDMTNPYDDPTTTWRVTELTGAPFPGETQLSFPTSDTIAGKADCNQFGGAMTADWPAFAVGPLAATEMACPGLDRETAFFAAVDTVTRAALDGTTLVLSGPAGDVLRLIPAD